jgi:hypothetical protein
MKELVPITVSLSWGVYDDDNYKRTPIKKELTFVPETKEISLPKRSARHHPY